MNEEGAGVGEKEIQSNVTGKEDKGRERVGKRGTSTKAGSTGQSLV